MSNANGGFVSVLLTLLFCILYFIFIFLLLLPTWRIKPDDDYKSSRERSLINRGGCTGRARGKGDNKGGRVWTGGVPFELGEEPSQLQKISKISRRNYAFWCNLSVVFNVCAPVF